MKEINNKCPNCGSEIKENQKFCPNCGANLQEQITNTVQEETKITCSVCGAICNSGDVFCGECGNNLTDNIDNENSTEDKTSETTNNEYINPVEQFLEKKSVKICLITLMAIILIVGLCFGYKAHEQYKKDTEPCEVEMPFTDCPKCKIEAQYINKNIVLTLKTDEIIENWQNEYFRHQEDNIIELEITNNDYKQKIAFSDITLIADLPLSIEFTINNAKVSDFVKIKEVLNADTKNYVLSTPTLLVFNKKDRKQAYKEYQQWQREEAKRKELEEIANRTSFVNIGSNNRIDKPCYTGSDSICTVYEVSDIYLSESLTRTTNWGNDTEKIYPKHGYFTIIKLKELNNESAAKKFDIPWGIYDVKYRSYSSVGHDYDEISINPGDVGIGSEFYDLRRDEGYFMGESLEDHSVWRNRGVLLRSYRGIYIDETRKEYCVSNSPDLIENQDKCTRILIDKFFKIDYENKMKYKKQQEAELKQKEIESNKKSNQEKEAENVLF